MFVRPLINSFILRSKMLVLASLDFAGIIFAILFSHRVLELPKGFGEVPAEPLWLWVLFLSFTFCCQFSLFYIAQLYVFARHRSDIWKSYFLQLVGASLLTTLLIGVFCYLTKFSLGRDVLALGTVISFGISLFLRFLAINILSPKYLGLLKAQNCAVYLPSLKPGFIEVLQQNQDLKTKCNFIPLPQEVAWEALEDFIKQNSIEIILISSATNLTDKDEFLKNLIKLKFEGIQVGDLDSFLEKTQGRLNIPHINDAWFINSQLFNEISNPLLLRAKRIFDILVLLVVLPLALPLTLFCWLAVKVFSPESIMAPGLYSQDRVGLNGRVFSLFKLRTMVLDSNKDGIQWTTKDDPRVTKIGRILRKSRLDELPQLYNVLIGDMSLIGPRPERPEYTQELSIKIPYYDLRHSIRPGLTGWAQINEPLATPSESLQKLEYDLFYIRHLSLWLELDIILKTIRIVFLRQGH